MTQTVINTLDNTTQNQASLECNKDTISINETDVATYKSNCDKIWHVVSQTYKAAHETALVKLKAKDVNEVIENYNREKAISTLISTINRYYSVINGLSGITGIKAFYSMDIDLYKNKTNEVLLCDLKYIRNIIYCTETTNTVLKATIEKGIKKLGLV